MTHCPFRKMLGLVLSTLILSWVVASANTVSFPPHTFSLPDGYELELAAGQPLVERPIHMYFDEDGSLYVTDSSGNSEVAPLQLANPSHRILRLVDVDGDGVFDQSTVFADKVPFPEGILVYDGDVYVGAPPQIWKFSDTDGDFVADERTTWFNGGTVEKCGNDLHGPYLAPDGYFYWTKGYYMEQSFLLGNGELHRSKAPHIFRAKPDGSNLEVFATSGMNNPVGLTFGETGDRFLSGTFFALPKTFPGLRDGISHAVYGGVYGRNHAPALASRPRTGDFLPVMSHTGPSAPSGVVMPRSDALGLKGDLLCADFNLRRISLHRLSRSGSSYATEIETLLESDQAEFHPTDVIEDADGSILVADTSSWWKMCCPTSTIVDPADMGGIYRIRRTDATSLVDPRGFELDWKKPSVAYLSDERPVVVRRAIDALAKEAPIDELRASKAGVPALWALHRIEGEAARKAVREKIGKGSAEERSVAMQSAALWRDPKAVALLSRTLASVDEHLRRLAAMALGRIGDRSASQSLLEAWNEEDDPFLKHAITYALFEIGAIESVAETHPVGKQLRIMEKVAQRGHDTEVRPDIQWADPIELDGEKIAHKYKRMAELREILKEGDARRGEKLFTDASKSLCITCHRLGDQGVDYGPDLTKIGGIRNDRDLMEAIVFPSASITRYYERVDVQTKQGRVVSGVISSETEDTMTLSPAPGAEIPVRSKDIVAAKFSNISLMPEVFDSLLNPQELADIVAYLKQAK